MRQLLPCFLLSLFTAGGSTSGQQPATAGTDLQGTWELVSAEYSGNKSTSKVTLEFKDGKMTRKLGTSKTGTTYTYYINTTVTPHQIELMTATDLKSGKVQKGIYKVEGDQLTICYQGPSAKLTKKPRPTAFATNKGDGNYLYVLKRQN